MFDDQKEKAKKILEKSLIDLRFTLEYDEFERLSSFEKDLYYSDSLYMMKEPAIIEKISCGLVMQPCVYKVFKELSLEVVNKVKHKVLDDYLLEFREDSSII